MKILHINDHLDIRGGAEILPYLLSEGLKSTGHESYVSRVHSCEAHIVQGKLQADLWHLHNMQSYCGMGLIAYLKAHDIPHVLSLHDAWHTGCPERTLWYNEAEGRCSCWCKTRRLDWVEWAAGSPTIACSESQAELCQEIAGFDPTWTVPHGIDTTLFSPTPFPVDEQPMVLCGTARAKEKWKGGWMFLEAIEMLPESLRKTVRFEHVEGGLSQVGLRDKYRRAWFGVFPSLCAEAFGLMAVEMMACGRPVVTTDLGGYRETVEHEEAGLRVEPNAVALSEGIEVMLRVQPATLAVMGQKALARVRERYLAHQMVDRYITIYEELLGSEVIMADGVGV